jgi:pimeloyl-ACP methyl ester carboxylesterase
MEPRYFSQVVLMGIPPAKLLLCNLPKRPGQLRQSWYRFLFQIPMLAEVALKKDDYGLLEQLWREWNPYWHPSAERLAEVRETFRAPGTVRATVACCRHPMRLPALREPGVWEGWRLVMRKLDLPALVIAGLEDRCFRVELFEGLERSFLVRSRFEVIRRSGHFMHLTDPDPVADRIREFAGCLKPLRRIERVQLRRTPTPARPEEVRLGA